MSGTHLMVHHGHKQQAVLDGLVKLPHLSRFNNRMRSEGCEGEVMVVRGKTMSGTHLMESSWTLATSSTGWTGRWATLSVVFDNKMWVIGGSI